MTYQPNIFLDYPFTSGQNVKSFELKVDLNLVRKFHKAAELEAQIFEEIHSSESVLNIVPPYTGAPISECTIQSKALEPNFYYTLADNEAFITDVFDMSLEIERIELGSFKDQIKRLKKRDIPEVHYHSLIYLVLQVQATEKRIFSSYKTKYSNLVEKLEVLANLLELQESEDAMEVKIKLPESKEKLRTFTIQDKGKFELINILIGDIKREIIKSHSVLIKDFNNQKVTVDLNNRQVVAVLLKKIKQVIKNPTKVSTQYYLSKVFKYIRHHNLFGVTSTNCYPTFVEARLIYFIICICKLRNILMKDSSSTPKRAESPIKQNDVTISSVVIAYKRLETGFITPADKDVFEQYLGRTLD